MSPSLILPWTLALACAGAAPPRPCPPQPPAAPPASSAADAVGPSGGGPPGAVGAVHAHGASDSEHAHPHATHGAVPGSTAAAGSPRAHVVSHAALQSFENNGNRLVGIATVAHGARAHEVWRSSVAVGSQTPKHRHESEEVFVFLRGKGRAVIGGEEFLFEAPATVIAPANVEHQFFNTGSEPTDAIVIVGIGSRIYDTAGTEMQLPWRK